MMGLLSSAGTNVLNRVKGPRASTDGSGASSTSASPRSGSFSNGYGGPGDDKAPSDTEPDDTSILDENEGSIITSLISQLRVGMDLSRVTFPTFVLEPRSMLERITDFMSHPDLIFGAEAEEDPEERFIRVLQYYLAGWHIKPKGVKKPYNPVLGEFFRCRYDYPDGTHGFYIAEQVSHHPPISAFFYVSPANHVKIIGELRPKSKFLGNSVSTTMEGENRITLLGKPDDGEYVITMPNMYARGILFGKMVLELGDTCIAKNEKHNLFCDLEFKTKGFFSGTYNAIAGKVRKGMTEIGEIGGRWSHVMDFRDAKTGKRRILFDAVKDGQNICPKWVPPESEQAPNESRRLWSDLTQAIIAKDMERATDAKSFVETAQREDRRIREERGEEHIPKYFELRDGRWVPKFVLPKDSVEATKAVEQWIFPEFPTPTDPPAGLDVKAEATTATTTAPVSTEVTSSTDSTSTAPPPVSLST
ncbi:oxysterol-binding protein family [Coprinopsis cinerea okayama7|uniref:Oxysterol-binding protein family n=1 Tax=Coprinopsis cinerea (strain Okayama-7 / 130 / ATCC MYA-4618 / FGSC 9003) TaxID=240176 RepID=A8N0U7_COPC7|nr:oxysterol-binding protein family [Coprinopsis cinerea okayama7\|eukprot:XP_001828498.2 oxysterol-binding protein family [Coprinopsis cinerea okayama7\